MIKSEEEGIRKIVSEGLSKNIKGLYEQFI